MYPEKTTDLPLATFITIVVYLGYINPFSLPIFPVSHLADQTFHTSRL
jgi:hypothetical protein